MLGELTKKFETIAICGTHGKTTTTGILSHVLNNSIGCNYLIGDGTGDAKIGNTKFVIEACEYQQHFLNYYPTYTIITNIDLDHVDFYHNIDEIVATFAKFVEQTKKEVIACGDDKNVRKIKSDKIIYYGLNSDNDICATNIKLNADGSTFDVIIKNKLFGTFNLHIYGNHMIQNVLPIIYLSSCFGLTKEQIDEKIDEIIEFSELGDFIDNPVRTYSSGMYMRLAFSVAINVQAEILLIDEILAVGDQHFQDKCFNKLIELKKSGKTIVIVTHSMEQVKRFCDRAVWLYKGEIRKDGKVDNVLDEYLKVCG